MAILFKMLNSDPRLVIGFDPVLKLFYNFQWIKSLIHAPQLVFEPLGVEHIKVSFAVLPTVILCLGLLYHLRDPVSALYDMHQSWGNQWQSYC